MWASRRSINKYILTKFWELIKRQIWMCSASSPSAFGFCHFGLVGNLHNFNLANSCIFETQKSLAISFHHRESYLSLNAAASLESTLNAFCIYSVDITLFFGVWFLELCQFLYVKAIACEMRTLVKVVRVKLVLSFRNKEMTSISSIFVRDERRR